MAAAAFLNVDTVSSNISQIIKITLNIWIPLATAEIMY